MVRKLDQVDISTKKCVHAFCNRLYTAYLKCPVRTYAALERRSCLQQCFPACRFFALKNFKNSPMGNSQLSLLGDQGGKVTEDDDIYSNIGKTSVSKNLVNGAV